MIGKIFQLNASREEALETLDILSKILSHTDNGEICTIEVLEESFDYLPDYCPVCKLRTWIETVMISVE